MLAVRSKCFDVFRYVFGFDATWRDVRAADTSVALVRIALFIAIGWVGIIVQNAMLNGDVAAYAALRANGNYTPFGLLMLYGHTPPSPLFWSVIQVVSWISTCMAIIGLCTRPAMVISTLSVMLLVLLDASRFLAWSHPYNIVFLCAIPFMFAHAGQSLSLDKWIARKRPNYFFAPTNAPVFWAVLAVQYSAALAYFAAFWAKAVVAHGGWDYVFSDNMRHILAVTWYGYVEMAVPSFIAILGSQPWLWQSIAAVHLVMQAMVVLIVFAVHRPHVRFFEGIIFALSCIGLYVLMSVSNPWWLLLVAAFIDWDYYVPRMRHAVVHRLGGQMLSSSAAMTSRAVLRRPVALVAAVLVFYGVYCFTFLIQKADELGIYPFSDMNMYAAVYAMKPYNEHLPYVDIMHGDISIELPTEDWAMEIKDGRWIRIDQMSAAMRKQMLPRISRKGTRETPVLIEKNGKTVRFPSIADSYPLLAREMNLDKLKSAMDEFLEWLAPNPDFPKGSLLVLRQETIAYSAYPKPLGQTEVYHSGIRAVYDFTRGIFVGAAPTLDYATRTLQLNGKGITRVGKLFASGGVLVVPSPEPYVEVEGRWVDDNTFEISEEFFARYSGQIVNVLIEADTQLGTYRFDAPVMRW